MYANKSIIAALVLGTELVMAAPKFAVCNMVANPADDPISSIGGVLLFKQGENEEEIRVFGSLFMDVADVELDEGKFGEWRGMAVTENAFDGVDCDNNGEIYNPFEAEYLNLKPARFGSNGNACYRHKEDTQTTLWGENSVIGKSVSLYEENVQEGWIQACCNIEELSREQYIEAMDQMWADKQQRKEDAEGI